MGAALLPRPFAFFDILCGMDKLIVVSGGGSYPRLLIEGAKRAGVRQVDCLAVRGSTARATWKAADHVHWITLGGIAEGIRWCGQEGYEGAFLAGQVNPLSLFRAAFDREVARGSRSSRSRTRIRSSASWPRSSPRWACRFCPRAATWTRRCRASAS